MWRAIAVAAMIAAPGHVIADMAPLTGPEIAQTLTDSTVVYPAATQTFYPSGRTLYDAGLPSWGSWRVEGDQYCSQWPPSDLWACYGMARDGNILRFVAEDGSVTDGVLQD